MNKYLRGILVFAIFVGLALLFNHRPTTVAPTPPRGWETYKNAEYGFQISYPNGITPETTFERYYHLPNTWRSGAVGDSTGKPIVTIPVYRITNENSYPRYFDAELRIGASADPKDVKNCFVNDQDYADRVTSSVMLNGTELTKFTMANAGMMQYIEGTSYRTIRNGACFVIEQLKTGSSYRDGPPSTKDIPEEVLNSHYNNISKILSTIWFTK